MGAKTRPYLIEQSTPFAPGRTRVIVEASNPAQALRHVAEKEYTVSVPSALEVIALMREGVAIEKAGEAETPASALEGAIFGRSAA